MPCGDGVSTGSRCVNTASDTECHAQQLAAVVGLHWRINARFVENIEDIRVAGQLGVTRFRGECVIGETITVNERSVQRWDQIGLDDRGYRTE